MVKVDEGGADGKGEWVHEMITTYFETEWKLHGQEISREFFFLLFPIMTLFLVC